MRTTPRFFLPLAVALLVSTRATAADPTASDLIARAPLVSSADSSVKSIEIAGYSASDGKIKSTFRALYQAPGHFAFLTCDGASGAPIAFTVDRNMFAYDPVRPELVFFTDATQYFDWGVEDGKPKGGFGYKFWSRESDRIVVDFKAMFGAPDDDGAPPRATVVKTGDRQYTLIQKRKKFYLRSRVDLSRACPFTTLEFADGPDADPYYCIDKIVINGALSPAEFAFPSKERLAGVVTVREVNAESLRNEFEATMLLFRTLSVRDDLRKAASRPGLIGPALRGARWRRVEENDGKLAPLLKEMVPAGPAHTLAGRPAKKDDPDTIRTTTWETIREHLPRSPIKIRVRIN